MTEEELKEARKKYNDEIFLEDQFTTIQNKISKLEKDPKVQEYIILSNLLKELEENLSQLKKTSFKKMADFVKRTKESNKIMVYMGHESFWLCYKDIETCEIYRILYNDVDEFERENIVIGFESNLGEKFEYEKRFNELRKNFLELLLNQPQCVAIKKLVKGSKK